MTTPVIGAAMPVEELPTYRDWLLQKQRDIEIQSFTRADVLMGDWRPLAEEAVRLLDGHTGRRGIHGPFWGVPLNSMDPEVQEVVARRVDQALDVCGVLGAVQMVLHSPYTKWMRNNFDAVPGWREGTVASVHDTLRGAVRRAEDMGVTLVLENIEDCGPEERVDLAASFDSASVKVSLDTGHAQCAHYMFGAPPVDYHVKAAGADLRHIHLQDVDGYADRHWSVGEGSVPWHRVFAALAETGATPHLILELRDYAKIPASMAWLEREGLGA
ncbi:MAG: sugar phosphate isomerase/epimerase family protein [Pseudomonadota bacterium]